MSLPFAPVVASIALTGAVVGLGAAGSPAGGSATAGHGAGFLARELAVGDGLLNYPGTDQPDYGVTLDAVIALIAAGSARDQAQQAIARIETGLDTYLGPAFGPSELYAGPVAKSALVASVMAADPRAFGGRDLVADLRGLEDADGRFADRTAYGDTSNTFTQAISLLALRRAATPPSPAALEFLLEQQCDDGGFRTFPGDEPCRSDADSTSMAVLALVGDAGHDGQLDAALDSLVAAQDDEGGVAGGVGASSANSNSTGLAAAALAAGSQDAAAGGARTFLMSLQLDCSAPAALRGAVAYDQDGYDALLTAGPGAVPSDQERRATAQAILGLAQADLSTLSASDAVGPTPGCTDDSPTSSPTLSATSSTTSSATGTSTSPSTGSGSPSHAATTTRPPTITTTARTANRTTTVTVTVTPTDPAADMTREVSAIAEPVTAQSTSGPSGTTSSAVDRAGSTDAAAMAPLGAAAVSSAPAAPDRAGIAPWLIAGSLVAAGATGALTILRRGRTH